MKYAEYETMLRTQQKGIELLEDADLEYLNDISISDVSLSISTCDSDSGDLSECNMSLRNAAYPIFDVKASENVHFNTADDLYNLFLSKQQKSDDLIPDKEIATSNIETAETLSTISDAKEIKKPLKGPLSLKEAISKAQYNSDNLEASDLQLADSIVTISDSLLKVPSLMSHVFQISVDAVYDDDSDYEEE